MNGTDKSSMVSQCIACLPSTQATKDRVLTSAKLFYIIFILTGKLSDSFTNYNYVGNTKVSVSIKKLKPTNAH